MEQNLIQSIQNNLQRHMVNARELTGMRIKPVRWRLCLSHGLNPCLNLRLDTFEDDADAYCAVVKQFASFDSHHSSALYPRKAAFSLGQRHCAREIQLDNMPARKGVVAGMRTSTPLLLILELLPLKNLFASGSQTLTGQATGVLVFFLFQSLLFASLII